jgi:Fe2+ or Zn2+ uptake regulation protein
VVEMKQRIIRNNESESGVYAGRCSKCDTRHAVFTKNVGFKHKDITCSCGNVIEFVLPKIDEVKEESNEKHIKF